VKIECLACLKETAIPKNLDTMHYDGQIICRECGSLLQVKLVKSKVQQCKLVREGPIKIDPAEIVQAFRDAQPEIERLKKEWLPGESDNRKKKPK
jgi:hypothetical protein